MCERLVWRVRLGDNSVMMMMIIIVIIIVLQIIIIIIITIIILRQLMAVTSDALSVGRSGVPRW